MLTFQSPSNMPCCYQFFFGTDIAVFPLLGLPSTQMQPPGCWHQRKAQLRGISAGEENDTSALNWHMFCPTQKVKTDRPVSRLCRVKWGGDDTPAFMLLCVHMCHDQKWLKAQQKNKTHSGLLNLQVFFLPIHSSWVDFSSSSFWWFKSYLDLFMVFFLLSTMVNHHFSPPFGRICFGTFSRHRTSKSKVSQAEQHPKNPKIHDASWLEWRDGTKGVHLLSSLTWLAGIHFETVDVLFVMLVNSTGYGSEATVDWSKSCTSWDFWTHSKEPTFPETNMTWHLKMDGCEDKPFLLLFSEAFTLSFRECNSTKKR